MARFETFDRDIRIATADIAPEAINKALADFARAELASVIASGAGSPHYDIFVNGRPGVREEAVVAPGPILYEFSWWREIIATALGELVKASPKRTGRYARSFIVISKGRLVTDFGSIAPEDEVIITNAQPYVRKVQVGAMQMSVAPKMFDRARQGIFRTYRQNFLSCQVMFLNIGGGLDQRIPYILKRSQGRRKDAQAGMPITYPSLVMNMVQ